jgi:hypothetical protein
VPAERDAALRAMQLPELDALLTHLKSHRAWPL